ARHQGGRGSQPAAARARRGILAQRRPHAEAADRRREGGVRKRNDATIARVQGGAFEALVLPSRKQTRATLFHLAPPPGRGRASAASEGEGALRESGPCGEPPL